MIILDIPQGTPEWFAARSGCISASCFSKVFTATGSKTSGEKRKTYMYQLAGERISGQPEESTFESEWMRRGKDLEADARLWFEQDQGVLVQQVGVVYLDERRTISCSPDGLLAGCKEGAEIKIPKISTHIGYLDKGKLPTTYKPQVQGSMMVCDYPYWHFISYHPAVRPLHLLVERDDKYITLLREAVEEFDAEVAALVERLR